VKTTLEIPDELFREAKATAARRGESLKDFVNAALEARLEVSQPKPDRSGWRSVFGLVTAKHLAGVDKIVARDLETVDPSDWK